MKSLKVLLVVVMGFCLVSSVGAGEVIRGDGVISINDFYSYGDKLVVTYKGRVGGEIFRGQVNTLSGDCDIIGREVLFLAHSKSPALTIGVQEDTNLKMGDEIYIVDKSDILMIK